VEEEEDLLAHIARQGVTRRPLQEADFSLVPVHRFQEERLEAFGLRVDPSPFGRGDIRDHVLGLLSAELAGPEVEGPVFHVEQPRLASNASGGNGDFLLRCREVEDRRELPAASERAACFPISVRRESFGSSAASSYICRTLSFASRSTSPSSDRFHRLPSKTCQPPSFSQYRTLSPWSRTK
jgi:hypothetical protein